MREYVLDANALVRYFRDTAGSDITGRLIEEAGAHKVRLMISIINLGEVHYVLSRYLDETRAIASINKLRNVIEFVEVDERTAMECASLKFKFKMGFADCFAAELAMRNGAQLVTADPEFKKLGKRLKILALPSHKK